MKRYINLLPPEQQRNIHLSRLNSQVLSFGIWLLLSLLIFSTVLFAYFLVLRQRLEQTDREVAIESQRLEDRAEWYLHRRCRQDKRSWLSPSLHGDPYHYILPWSAGPVNIFFILLDRGAASSFEREERFLEPEACRRPWS